jgi:hypothetical protein
LIQLRAPACYDIWRIKEVSLMKKYGSILQALLPTIIGAFMLLLYMNLLGASGSTLALGIIGVIVAAYYLVSGIVGSLISENKGSIGGLLKKLNVVIFPTFMFVNFLITIIAAANGLGPTGWVISIFSLVTAIGFALFAIFNWAAKSCALTKITTLFGVLFILSLALTVFFDVSGAPNDLGDISLVSTVIYVLYTIMAVSVLGE